MQKPRQLVLPLDFSPEYNLEKFVICKGNKEAFLAISKICEEPFSVPVTLLYGDEGTGKTHLLRALEGRVKRVHQEIKLSFLECSRDQEVIMSHVVPSSTGPAPCMLLIEDVHLVLNSPQLEKAIFSFFNYFLNSGMPVIITSRVHPQHLNQLHDRLTSRFSSGNIIKIGLLDEETCSEILKKLADDRQIELHEKVIHYIIMRVPRNPAYLQVMLARIDKLSTQLKRPVTINLVRQVLYWQHESDEFSIFT